MSFEWYRDLQSVRYPFSDDAGVGLESLFVDAFIQHDRDVEERVKLTCFDPAGEGLALEFEGGASLLAVGSCGPDDYEFATFVLGDYTVYEWRHVSESDEWPTSDEWTARLVVVTASLPSFVFPLSPTNAFLLPRLTAKRPRMVRKLAVMLPGLDCCIGGGVADGHFVLIPGTNMRILPDQQDRLVFDAIPGEGEGRWLECLGEDPDILTVGGVGPDAGGNLSLEGRDCLWVERPVSDILPPLYPGSIGTPVFFPIEEFDGFPIEARLRVRSECPACADCEDYAAVYGLWRTVWEQAEAIAVRFYAALDLYKDLRNRLLMLQQDCGDIVVKVKLAARPDFHLGIGIILANSSRNAVTGVSLAVTILPTGFQVLTGSGNLDLKDAAGIVVDPAVSGNTATLTIGNMPARSTARYSFNVRWPTGTARANATARVQVVASTSAGSSQDSASAELRKPLVKT